jgi:Peptidase family M1 domain
LPLKRQFPAKAAAYLIFAIFETKTNNLKRLFILLIVCSAASTAICQQPYWQQQVNYTIDVTLNDTEHTLDGFVKMTYSNNSPDTLRFIWFHLWPNAFKNDRTAFSDQLLENGRTNFYFSNSDQRGYINQLDFKVNSVTATTEDHPQHQDIIKLLLPQPLAPGSSAAISTPFHVKLPNNFSRGGHAGQAYQATQWYPKPAVYDRKGWHPIPYLDQGEFYSEFGNYEVSVTLPYNYTIAATGELQNPQEKLTDLIIKKPVEEKPVKKVQKNMLAPKPRKEEEFPPSDIRMLTHIFKQNNVHDFAWFADKRFLVKSDTLQLPSGQIINLAAYYLPSKKDIWQKSISYIKKTILTRSRWLGEYPYTTVSVVEAKMGFSGGMEYPTITSISPVSTDEALESVIEHEVGHNWNYGILASNERRHAWMDEGINTFYDERYDTVNKIAETKKKESFFTKRVPENMEDVLLRTITGLKKDQPIDTPADEFTELNYGLMSYYKAGQWMKKLEQQLGTEIFDSCMHEFYRRWQFKHPYPEDLKQVFETVSGKNLDEHFALLYKKGLLEKSNPKKDIRLTGLFNLKNTDKHNYIGIAPITGYNFYDKVMLGAVIHNYSLPANKFKFAAVPMYATGSKQLVGLARLGYTWLPGSKGQSVELSVSGATFTGDDFLDSTGTRNKLRFSKIVPALRIDFAKKTPRSNISKYLLLKTFLISETGLRFTRDTVRQLDIITYPVKSRYVNQFQFVVENNRVLYPWRGALQVDQGDGFVRAAFTGNYFFNYAKGGGLDLRVFAGKFFYLGDKTFSKSFETDIYHLNMTGPKGNEDYTYSNYFTGRNEFEGYSSQQIMMRDGAFKVRTDLLSNKIGKTDNWLAAANFVTTIPKAINPLEILPVKIPLKFFVDIGTYAEAWKKNANTGRFIYDAGLQVSLVRDIINIYIPLFYSKVYKDYFLSTITEKRFLKNIAFSIDIQKISLKKFTGINVF